MKRFIFLLVALMPVLVFAQKAKIDFTTTSHNFGTINENAGKATFDFSFKNTGNVPYGPDVVVQHRYGAENR